MTHSTHSPTNHQVDIMSTPFVVVYGTLKKGYSNHRLLEDAEFLGSGLVYGPRVLNDTYPPTFTYDESNKLPFEGEVYKVTPEQLEKLDWLEGHPHAWFRTQVDVHTDEGNGVTNTLRAWCYFYYIDRSTDSCLIENGVYNWREGD